MRLSIQFVFFFAVLAAPFLVRADEQSDVVARAKAVAPYVDDLTVAVIHVAPTPGAVEPLAETLAWLMPELSEFTRRIQAEPSKHFDRFVEAGGKDVYFTVSLGGPGPFPSVMLILPLRATADEKAVRAALEIPAEAGRRVGDALVIPLRSMDNRPLEIRASQRPELATAFEAAGEGSVQAVLIPPAHTRRVIEELMPQLPKEIGNGPSSILTQGISWAAVGVDLPPHPALNMIIKSHDAGSAEALRGKWVGVLRLVGQQKEIRSAMPQFDQVAALLTPKVEGDRLILSLNSKTAAVDVLVAAIDTAIGQARDSACRAQSMNNLKQIALAMHMYYDSQKHFPAAATYGPDGRPLLSWRVYILPFIEQKQLFDQFHLNEPWDSPHNKSLIERMPAIFHSPKSKVEKGKTNYLVPVGNGALYASRRDEPKFEDIRDGTSQTIMMVEADDQYAVTWTKPDDLAFDPKDPKKDIGSLYEGGFNAAYCDGSVRFLGANIDPKTLTALFTRAGGEVIGPY
ncbi:MAG: DUF1559 domain-containing protein [Thermoguttaceae bacterium]